jgi:NitT/TauT family transport system ATP-binding protein
MREEPLDMMTGDRADAVDGVRAASAEPLIRIDGLAVHYTPEVPAVEDLTFDVAPGEFVALVGPSGCGKSTLMHVISGLMQPSRGTVSIGATGEAQRRIGYVFQDHRLLPWRTVRQNLQIALQAAGFPKERWDGLIADALAMLQIEQFADQWPLRLSGGQRQRVAIARALVIEPIFMLMDEPYSTLDEVTARTMRQELLRVWAETGKTIVFVTHSIREAAFLADRVVVLTRGPGRVLEIVDVDVPRPRDYESGELTRVEQRIVELALVHWGLQSAAG